MHGVRVPAKGRRVSLRAYKALSSRGMLLTGVGGGATLAGNGFVVTAELCRAQISPLRCVSSSEMSTTAYGSKISDPCRGRFFCFWGLFVSLLHAVPFDRC